MNNPPDISIVTINYNGLQDTKELIISLQKNLNSCSYELIIVDNGSEKNEAKLLEQEYPEILVIRSEQNLGFAGGNNLGIQKATANNILLLNNDTILPDDSIHFLYESLKEPSIGAVSPKIKFAYPPYNIQFAGFTPMSKFTIRNETIGYDTPDKGQYNEPHTTPFLHGAALMFKRELLDKIGTMSEIFFLYYEEMDWCTRIRQNNYILWYDPRCTILHKESKSTGRNSPLKTYYLTRNRLLYAWRNCSSTERYISIIYQLFIANSKNIIVNLLKRDIKQIKAIFKGCIDFLFLKNKTIC